MGSLIETRGMTKLFGMVIGVNDVSLDLEPGVIGLLGPNGAGKSTFLKLLTGQLRPTEGQVRVFGMNPWNNMQLLARIGLCPEHDSFYDSLSALEFVTSLAKISGLGAQAKERAEQALERVGATEFMHRTIGTYSKGMRQRTKVAQAIVHDPDFLILDEPLTGTDPICRREIIDIVLSLGEEGKSILIASHVLHEVQAMTDQFVLIYGGRVLASGRVQEIRSLMNEFPHRITMRCDDVKQLAQTLLQGLPVEGLEMDTKRGELVALTRDPDTFYTGLPEAVARSGVRVHELVSADDKLEAVFNYLMSVD
ncbi:MAG: ABC-2 type transport system ATP-binding protein [Chlamydiales bacterium]|jgi:ABC-2 type transport system ATP-binding protein